MLLGQLFFHASMAQAGRLCTAAWAKESITALLHVAKKRSFLAEACTVTVLNVLDGLSPDEAVEVVQTHSDIQELISSSPEDATPEALLLALHIWPLLPQDSRESCKLLPEGIAKPSLNTFQQSVDDCPRNGNSRASFSPVHHEADRLAASEFFNPKNLQNISHILKDASFVRHQLHSVWLHVLRLLIPSFVIKGHKATSESKQQVTKCDLHSFVLPIIEDENCLMTSL